MFALLIVPLLGLAAFAIDASQWQVGANQLQTAADAAALAGARAVELYPSAAQTQAVAYATAAAAANTAFAVPVAIASGDVEPAIYDPTNNSVTLSGVTWATNNAVKVTVRGTGRRTLSGVMMNAAPQVTRSAVAWIANITNGSCVKPWALPYQTLYDRVQAITGGTASTVSPRPDLTQTALVALSNYSEAQRILILRPPTYDGSGGNPDSTGALGSLGPGVGYNNGMYAGYNFLSPSGNNNASTTTYQANTFGCSAQTVSVNTVNGATLPGSNDIPCATVNALMGSTQNQCQPTNNWDPLGSDWPSGNNKPQVSQPVTCYYRAPSGTVWDAGCYATASAATAGTSPGVMETVAWGDNVGNGSNATDFREIGKFKVACVFRGIYTGNGAPAGHSENCTIGTTTLTNYPQGTLVGVIQGLTSPVIGSGTELGNTPSDQQRLILVR